MNTIARRFHHASRPLPRGRHTALATVLGAAMLAASGVAHAAPVEALVLELSNTDQHDNAPVGVLQGADGSLYGVSKGSSYNGEIFKVSLCQSYPFRTLVPFSAYQNIGWGLTQGVDGNLYGVDYGYSSGEKYGSIFRSTTAGRLDTVHAFDAAGGSGPSGPVVIASDGSIYGTTFYGGITGQNSNGYGTVYKIDATGKFSTLYDFGTESGRNGQNPQGRLVLGSDGSVYGTAKSGGKNSSGTVFKITAAGVASVVVSFGGGTAGAGPFDLLLAKDGNFYGRAHAGDGMVFALTPAGALSTLHGFTAAMDGSFAQPNYYTNYSDTGGTLFQAADGILYGVAEAGGGYSKGTVYGISPADGTFTVVYAFKGTSDGGTPVSLMQAKDGTLYGTAQAGGTTSNGGGVFAISLGGTLPTPGECTATTLPDGGTGTVDADGGTGTGTGTEGGAGTEAGTSDGGAVGAGAADGGALGGDSGVLGGGLATADGGAASGNDSPGGCSIDPSAAESSFAPWTLLAPLALGVRRRRGTRKDSRG